MTNKHFKTVQQVASWRLCTGCGACSAACPENNIRMVDVADQGLRPFVNSAKCQKCSECIKVCPGIEIAHQSFNSEAIPELRQAWGPVLEVWEGYAADSQICFHGSSGGVTTALALYCLEREKMAGVLQIGPDPKEPWRNVPVFSRNKEDLLACTGSRYSPAAPCAKLDWFEQAPLACVFVGKPCDVVALRKSQQVNYSLSEKVGLGISIFCAATPTSRGTQALLNALKVTPEEIQELRYRGCGWPGMTIAKLKGEKDEMRQMSYEESWGRILSHYAQFRCRLCPDSTGEFADIACGDPWYRKPKENEAGQSLILVRTDRGKAVLQKAISTGYIKGQQVDWRILRRSQKSLLIKRRSLFGRLLVMRMMRIPTPHFSGFSLFTNWCDLSMIDKSRSILSTFYRVISRKWYKPL
ncbi:MAG: Coenzyme F420 hydrogenase/dehydrogenase, beta subunit C-terminal domain [Desulfobacteraceae bacterium]|nr:Coenzyme F420 hydrogenase/dehydrogenase, beta subunit C-terminal domain [Desulfobacteraceae bacterium]